MNNSSISNLMYSLSDQNHNVVWIYSLNNINKDF